MPLNEYDEILETGNIPGAASGNEYVDLLDEQREEQKAALKQSQMIAVEKNPDQHAEVVKFARELKLPSDHVEQDFQELKKAARVESNDYDRLIDDTPGLGRWLAKPDHAVIAQDDVEHLAKTEKRIRDESYSGKLYDTLTSAFASMGANVSRWGGFMYAAHVTGPAQLRANLMGDGEEVAGYIKEHGYAPRALMDPPIAQELKAVADRNRVPEMSESAWGTLGKAYRNEMDWDEAGKVLTLQMAGSAPSIIATLAGIFHPAIAVAGLGVAGAATAGGELKEAEEKGMPVTAGVANAAIHGGVEIAAERLNLGILKHWEGAISKTYGRETARQVWAAVGKTLTASFFGEASEEAATSVAQDISSWASGVDESRLYGILGRAMDAGLLGGLSGATMSTPTTVGAGIFKGAQANRVAQQREAYEQTGDLIAESKSNARDSVAANEFVQEAVADSGLETVNIEAEDFIGYFQSRNLNPEQIAEALGVAEEFKRSREAGHPLKVPYAAWVANLPSEHYKGLADDVTFNLAVPSVNRVKRLEEEAAQDVQTELQAQERVEQDAVDVETIRERFREEARQARGPGISDEQAAHLDRVADAESASFASIVNAYSKNFGVTIDEAYEELKPAGILGPKRQMLNQVVQGMRDILSQGEVLQGGVMRSDSDAQLGSGEVKGRFGRHSTHADFFKGKGYSKKEAMASMDKYLNGGNLTPKQQSMLTELYNAFGKASAVTRETAEPFLQSAPIQPLTDDPDYFAKPEGKGDLVAPQLDIEIIEHVGGPMGPVVITEVNAKKNLKDHATEVRGRDNEILRKGLYEPTHIVPGKESGRWSFIHSSPDGSFRVLVAVRVDRGQFEVINWHPLRPRGLKQLLKNTGREDGRTVLITKRGEALAAVGRLSALPPGDSSIPQDPEDGEGPTFQQAAYHGTPHKFDKFSLQKIGTGEGQQAYGWGLYFAGNKQVAEWYRSTLAKGKDFPGLTEEENRAIPNHVAQMVHTFGTSQVDREIADFTARVEAARQAATTSSQPWLEESKVVGLQSTVDALVKLKSLGNPRAKGKPRGRLFEVEIPDATDMLDWDLPLSEQSEKVKAALLPAFRERGIPTGLDSDGEGVGYTGQQLYKELAREFSTDSGPSPEAASKFLLSLGIHGLRYLDGPSRDAKDGHHNYVVFDENLVEVKSYEQKQGDVFGQIQFTWLGPVITLFEKANASTLMHEMSHLWLDRVFKRVRDGGEIPEGFRKQWETLSEWLEIGEQQTELTEAQQEKFADGFEQYLREGKAPSKALRSAFRGFKLWLTRLYQDITQLGAPINDDVRAVFDRMLATQAEIKEAKREMGYQPVEVDTTGVDPKLIEKLETLRDRANEAAESILLTRQMEELKGDRKEFLAAKRSELEAASRDEIGQEQVYQAQAGLKDRVGSRKAPKALAAAFREGSLTSDQMTAFEIHAELNGYSSGDEMAHAITQAPDMDKAVRARVAEGMKAFADLKDTAQLREEALYAIHNEQQYELLSLEHEILHALMVTGTISETEKARRAAEAKIEGDKVRQTAHDEIWRLNIKGATAFRPLLTAERRAAVASAKALAAGEFARATTLKRQQMLNHQLARESIRAKEKAEKWVKFFRDLQRKDKDAFKKEEHFHQAAEILARLGFIRSDYNPDKRTETLGEWTTRLAGQTTAVAIPEWMQDETKLRSYKELSLNELQDVVNALRNITTVANFENRAYTIMNGADMNDIVAQLMVETDLNRKGRPAHKHQLKPSQLDKLTEGGTRMALSLIRVKNLFKSLQGFKDTGKWTEASTDAVAVAADHESELMQWMADGIDAKFGVYDKQEKHDLLNKAVFYPELGTSAPKMTLIMMALNLGNEGNSSKLFGTKPVGIEQAVEWNESLVRSLLQKQLTEKDWHFVQSVWDLIGERWGDIAKLHKDMTGFAPDKVPSTPLNLVLPSGKVITLKGGYFPLKSDYRADQKQAVRENLEDPLYTELNPGWKAQTRTGHTKARTGAQYAVSLDHTIIYKHLRDVIHDIAFRKTVTDLRRLMAREEVVTMIKERHGQAGYQIVDEWVKSIAAGQGQTGTSLFDRVSAEMRKRSSIAYLTFSLRNIVQNFSNISLYAGAAEGFGWSEVRTAMATKGLEYWQAAITDRKRYNEMRTFVMTHSKFMRDKNVNPDLSLSELQKSGFNERGIVRELVANAIGGESGTVRLLDYVTDKNEAVQEFGKGLMAATDEATSFPIWMHAYNLGLDRNMEHDEAVRYANLVIENSIGSSRKYDAPAIQRGSALEKNMFMFMTFMNGQLNRLYLEAGRASIEGGPSKTLVRKLATSPRFLGYMASSYLIFNVMSTVLAGKGPGEDDDELKWWAKQMLMYYPSMIPGVREVSGVLMDQMFGMKSYGLRPSPVSASATATLDFTKEVFKEDTDPEKLFETMSRSMSFMVPYPDQFNIWFWNAYDVMFKGMEPEAKDLMKRRPAREREIP